MENITDGYAMRTHTQGTPGITKVRPVNLVRKKVNPEKVVISCIMLALDKIKDFYYFQSPHLILLGSAQGKISFFIVLNLMYLALQVVAFVSKRIYCIIYRYFSILIKVTKWTTLFHTNIVY